MYFHHRRDTRATAARDDGRDGAPATASGAVAQALNASARVSSQYRLAQAINLRPQAIAQAKFAAAIARSPGPLPPQRVGSTAAHAGAQDAVVQRGIYFGKTGEEPPAEEERDADKEPAAEAKHDAEGQPDAESELDALAVVVDEVRNSAPDDQISSRLTFSSRSRPSLVRKCRLTISEHITPPGAPFLFIRMTSLRPNTFCLLPLLSYWHFSHTNRGMCEE